MWTGLLRSVAQWSGVELATADDEDDADAGNNDDDDDNNEVEGADGNNDEDDDEAYSIARSNSPGDSTPAVRCANKARARNAGADAAVLAAAFTLLVAALVLFMAVEAAAAEVSTLVSTLAGKDDDTEAEIDSDGDVAAAGGKEGSNVRP